MGGAVGLVGEELPELEGGDGIARRMLAPSRNPASGRVLARHGFRVEGLTVCRARVR